MCKYFEYIFHIAYEPSVFCIKFAFNKCTSLVQASHYRRCPMTASSPISNKNLILFSLDCAQNLNGVAWLIFTLKANWLPITRPTQTLCSNKTLRLVSWCRYWFLFCLGLREGSTVLRLDHRSRSGTACISRQCCNMHRNACWDQYK